VAGVPVSENHNRALAGQVTARGGRRQYQTAATQAWRGAVMVAVRNHLTQRHITLTPPLAVVCIFVNTTGDPPNYLKTTLDAIQDATHINDKTYRPLMVDGQRHKGHPKGVLIELWSAPGPNGDAA
jgi:Holliday junction resolvase RusA-like endonuclease